MLKLHKQIFTSNSLQLLFLDISSSIVNTGTHFSRGGAMTVRYLSVRARNLAVGVHASHVKSTTA